MRLGALSAFVVAGLALCAPAARADSVADFYRGKQIDIIVGSSPGGGYDIYARLLAQHMPRFIPGNPSIIVQNMPGAGGLRSANYLYQSAPKDGTTIGIFQRDMTMLGVLGGNPNVQYDVRKFGWLGSASSFSTDAYILWERKNGPVKTIADVLGPNGPPLLMGATGAGSSAGSVPTLLHDALGLNIKVIPGYVDSAAVGLAVDRGEVDAQFASFSVIHLEKPHWLGPDSPVIPLLQYGRVTRHPDLPNVPTARELAPNEHSRLLIELAEAPWAISRPFVTPPGVPDERVAALRQAFMAAQADSAYLADAARAKVDVSPMDGVSVLQLIDKMADAPPDLLDYMRQHQSSGGD